jgi:riboflavin synthase
MFTGLVQAVGTAAEVSPAAAGVRLLIDPGGWVHRPAAGESICVSGVCLTVAAAPAEVGGCLAFDVVPETLRRTTLGTLRPGSRVNLERSLAVGDLMGGHTVQGHVDGVAKIERVETGGEYRVSIRPPPELMVYLVPKGSVAVDGVSLTVAAVVAERGTFDVALIPTTLAQTTLGELRPGATCNLETDVLARTVVQYLKHYAGRGGES